MDVDWFQRINDSLGHPIGDQLLRSVAEQLTMCVRGSDAVGRQGEDEFVILLSEIEQPSQAMPSSACVLRIAGSVTGPVAAPPLERTWSCGCERPSTVRTTGAAGSTIGSAPPLEANGTAETQRPAIFAPAAIGNGSALARGLHVYRPFGCVRHLTLQSDAAARRIQHLEQPLVQGLRARVGGALSDSLAEIACGGLDGRALPRVHRVQLYRISIRAL
jgi:hypothetical protein